MSSRCRQQILPRLGLVWLVGLQLSISYAQTSEPAAPLDQGQTNELAENSPELVYVVNNRCRLHSGPSEDHYPTGNAAWGQTLEVYHRTADGWLGVRPPDGSFSWVPATDAYLLPGGRVIEITEEKAVSWIGTELGSAKEYRWQVRLTPGEQLAVLGETTRKAKDGSDLLWYRVSPPAGEFRWIHSRSVRNSPPTAASGDRAGPGSSAESPTNGPSKQAGLAGASAKVSGASANVTTAEASDDGDAGSVKSAAYVQRLESPPAAGFQDDVFDDASILESPTSSRSRAQVPVPARASGRGGGRDDHWEGWHAIELTDNGFEFPFLDRLLGRGTPRPQYDPLDADPYDLSMPTAARRRRTPPNTVASFTSPERETPRTAIADTPADRPWRDPRELRQQRLADRVAPPGRPFRLAVSTSLPDDDARALRRGDAGTSSTTARLVASSRPLPSGPGASSFSSAPGAVGASDVDWYGVHPDRAAVTDHVPAKAATSDLNQLQLALSETVAQPMTRWNLGPLLERTRELIEHGATPIDRGQARLLLERIEEFQQLAHRSGIPTGSVAPTGSSGLASGSGPIMQASFSAPSAAGRPTSAAGQALVGQSQYDATGWLVPVHTAKVGQPSYALADDNGRVLAYVSGLPGMNLDLYLNQAVGIKGLRGYLPQLMAGHIQAQRVSRLH